MEEDLADALKMLIHRIELDDNMTDVEISQDLWDDMREARTVVELYESKKL